MGSVSQWERPQGRLEKIAKSSPHQILGNVGSQISTPTHEDLNLAASSIRAYKAAISCTCAEADFTPAQLGMLNKLCNMFHKRRSLKSSPIPTWDIRLVLRAFTLAPFEPLDSASLQAVTYI